MWKRLRPSSYTSAHLMSHANTRANNQIQTRERRRISIADNKAGSGTSHVSNLGSYQMWHESRLSYQMQISHPLLPLAPKPGIRSKPRPGFPSSSAVPQVLRPHRPVYEHSQVRGVKRYRLGSTTRSCSCFINQNYRSCRSQVLQNFHCDSVVARAWVHMHSVLVPVKKSRAVLYLTFVPRLLFRSGFYPT